MSTSPIDNLYWDLELFLDPPENDFDALKKELANKITEWNKLANVPGSRYKHMVQVAAKFCAREQPPEPRLHSLSAEAKKYREAEGRKAAATYEEDGILDQKEYDELHKVFGQFFTKATIDSWLTLRVTIFAVPEKPVYSGGIEAKIVDKMTMDSVADYLKIVLGNENANLYTLLGVGQNTSLATIQKTRKDAYEKAFKKPKTGPESAKVDAAIRVLGLAGGFFKDENSKEGYDIACKRRPFDRLVDDTFQKRALKGSVTHDEYVRSIEEARQTGFSPQEAEWYVYEYYCVKRKLPPPKRQVILPLRQQCPECFALNDVDAKFCQCGLPLKILCPQCGREGSFGEKACTGCGFPLGDMPNAVKRVEMARKAVAEGNIDETEEHIRYINLYWKEAPGAAAVRHELDDLKNKIKAFRQHVKDLESQITQAIGTRSFYEAERLFRELRQHPEATRTLETEEKHVAHMLEEVRQEIAELASLDELSARIELCEKVLALAADCPEAGAFLASVPPLPPENLVATVIPTGIALTWTPPTAKSVLTFVVVRKVGGVPASVSDGIRLQDGITCPKFVDSAVEAGIVYGYAVFTQRDRTIETIGCRSELQQKIDDVSSVSVVPNDGALTLSWAKQPGSCGMIVTRFADALLSGDGVSIPLQRENSLIDSPLDNEQTYFYKIQTVFRGLDGQDVVSGGMIVTGKPQVPPRAVADLRVGELPDGTNTLHWTAPEQGEVLLFDLDTAPDVSAGSVEWTTPVELKQRYGEPIPVLQAGQTLWTNPAMGVRYILPVTFQAGIAVFGASLSLVKIADIADLNLDYIGDKIRLTWTWIPGLKKVLMAYRHDQFPDSPDDEQSAKIVLSQQEYELKNSWILPMEDSQDYYFCIYAVVDQQAGRAFSRGRRIQTAKTIIQYDLVIRRRYIYWGAMDVKIVLTNESRREGFPDLMVRRDFGKPPLNRDFGVLLCEIPAQDGRKVIVPLSAEHWEEGAYIKIFVKYMADAEHFILDSPPRQNLRLCFKKPSLARLFRKIAGG